MRVALYWMLLKQVLTYVLLRAVPTTRLAVTCRTSGNAPVQYYKGMHEVLYPQNGSATEVHIRGSFMQGLIKRMKLAQHAYKEDHLGNWTKAIIFELRQTTYVEYARSQLTCICG